MKFITSLLFCFLFVASGLSQTRTDTVYSKKLNEERVISISLPPSYDREKDRKYPLLFLMDGEYLLPAFKGALDYGNYWEDLPEMIIVALHQNSNNQREADCTVDGQTGLPEGRGNQFFDFIGMELLPAVEKKYRVAPLKVAAGHDLTAGFLNFFLYKDIPVFDGYILLSPELSEGMENHVAERLAAVKI